MANKTIYDLDGQEQGFSPTSTSLFAMYENGSTGKASVQQVLNTTIPGLGSTSGMSVKNAINGLTQDIDDIENLNFESQDTSQTPDTPIASTNISLLSGTDTWPQRFVKISQMFKNIRYLLGKLGNTDISSVSTEGTVTGAIKELDERTEEIEDTGWVDLTQYFDPNHIFTIRTTDGVEFTPKGRVKNGIVYFTGGIALTSTGQINNLTIFSNLPTQFRPTNRPQISGSGITTNGRHYEIWLNQAGNFRMKPSTYTASSTEYFYLDVISGPI